MWRPYLIPNDKGATVNWHERLEIPSDWLVLTKRDGARVEISKEWVKGRSLKPIISKHILKMAKDLQRNMNSNAVVEAEFYSHGMTFPEIIHFFKTEDVTSEKTKKKYRALWKRTQGMPSKGWKFPGRSVEWLTSWHKSLHFRMFDTVNLENIYQEAHLRLARTTTYATCDNCEFGPLQTFNSVDDILDFYEQVLADGYEGLVLMHKNGTYKLGKATLKEATIYKMKDDKNKYDGEIIELIQATVVNPMVPTTTNELGRTVTSKKQDDRIAIEAISGFRVRMDDGSEQKVSLRGWDDGAKAKAWKAGMDYYRETWIIFSGMPPVKEGGAIRSPQFYSFRDAK